MTRLAYIRPFTDVTVLAGPYNSKLVMRLGQRFESARRLFTTGLDKRINRNRGSYDRTKEGFLTPPAFSGAGVDPLRSGLSAIYRYERRGKKIIAYLTCDPDFEPIAAGSWERVGVMETSSRRTLRGPRGSSQVNALPSVSAVPGRARRCSCTTAAPQPPSDRRRRRGRGASGSARSAPRCAPSRGSDPRRALRPQARRSR